MLCGSLQRSADPLAGEDGLSAHPQELHPRSWPFGPRASALRSFKVSVVMFSMCTHLHAHFYSFTVAPLLLLGYVWLRLGMFLHCILLCIWTILCIV